MTVWLDRLSVWLPGRGTVLSQVSAEFSGVTALVGRNGSGATTLLRTLAGVLPAGARVSGDFGVGELALSRLDRSELASYVHATHLAAVPSSITVARLLARTKGADPLASTQWLDRLGVDPRASVGDLDRGQLAGVRLLLALADPRAGAVLLDQPLGDLPLRLRAAARELLRESAEWGVTVVWAEHQLEDCLPGVDHVAELHRSGALTVSPVESWSARTIPLPPAMALARLLGLDRSVWSDPARSDRWTPGDQVDQMIPHPGRLSRADHRGGDVVATAEPGQSRLDRPIDLRSGVCLGVVSTNRDRDRELDVARRLTALARGLKFLPAPLVLPNAVPVGRVIADWQRASGADAASTLAAVTPFVSLDPRRSTERHSTGERTALATALAMQPDVRLLVDPTRGMDPAGRRHLARTLYDDADALTVLVTDDVEVLSRACHRILVIDGDSVVADGAPLAVLGELPDQPSLARLGVRALRVSDLGQALASPAVVLA